MPNIVSHELERTSLTVTTEESLERLGIERFQLLHLHDPDLQMDFASGSRKGGAVDALVSLKEHGIAEGIGIATGNLQRPRDTPMPMPRPMTSQLKRTAELEALLPGKRYARRTAHLCRLLVRGRC